MRRLTTSTRVPERPAGITRKGFFSGIVAAAVAVPIRTATATPTKCAHDIVTQQELQAAIDAWNECERLCGTIRMRLESGAEMERGRLGVSTFSQESLAWYLENGGVGGCKEVDLIGINIAPVEDLLEHDVPLAAEYPEHKHNGITLV